jgi:hypothetical protein
MLRVEGTTFGLPYGASLALVPILRRRSAALSYRTEAASSREHSTEISKVIPLKRYRGRRGDRQVWQGLRDYAIQRPGRAERQGVKDFIGPEMRFTPVVCTEDSESEKTIKFYMGSNTPERKDYIMDNLVCDASDF